MSSFACQSAGIINCVGIARHETVGGRQLAVGYNDDGRIPRVWHIQHMGTRGEFTIPGMGRRANGKGPRRKGSPKLEHKIRELAGSYDWLSNQKRKPRRWSIPLGEFPDRLGERVRRFLRHVMADTRQDATVVETGDLLRILVL